MGIFFRRSMAADFAVPGRISPNFELIRNFMVAIVTCNCNSEEDLIQNEGARLVTRFSPIITLWALSVAMEISFLIRSGRKPYAAFSPSK